MAKPLYFTPWRRITMQAVMCAILAGSVGVAALVDRHLNHLQQEMLSGPIIDGPVSFYFPSGWKRTDVSDRERSVHKAIDSDSERGVILIRQRIDRIMPPLQYLRLSGLLDGMQEQHEARMIGNWPGQLITAGTRNTEPIRLMGCVVLPTREAITLVLELSGPADVADLKLFNLLLNNIKINGIPAPESGAVQFPGVTITLPANFQVMPEPDPLCTQRRIFSQTSDEKDVMAEITPVLLPADTPAESMKQILAGQELNSGLDGLGWFNAQVSQEAPDRWRIDPQDSSPQSAPKRRAYLVGQPGTQGVLISMQPVDINSDLDSAWRAISSGILFSQATDLKTLLSAGTALAHAAQPIVATDRYFLYTRNNIPDGLIHDSLDTTDNMHVREIDRLNWNGVVTYIIERWSISSTMLAHVTRSDVRAGSAGPFPVLMDSVTHVTDVFESTTKGLEHSRVLLPLPLNFVLSANLPDLLAKAPVGTMAIWTDRFPGCEGDFLLRPILLTVRNTGDFVEVQVNGSGQLSRWYFAKDATLRHADFPGGLVLQPATQAEAAAAFSNTRLTPTP